MTAAGGGRRRQGGELKKVESGEHTRRMNIKRIKSSNRGSNGMGMGGRLDYQ